MRMMIREREGNMFTNAFELSNQSNQRLLSPEVIFYTIADIQERTHWSEATVQKMFNDPSFPSANFGRTKIVEAHALINYFSGKRSTRHSMAKQKLSVLQVLQSSIFNYFLFP